MKSFVPAIFKQHRPMAWLVLVFGLLLVVLANHALYLQTRATHEQEFELHVQNVISAISSRMRRHEQILLGGAGLFDASPVVSRDAWRTYVARLQLERNYPGIQGVGYSQIMAPEQLAAHVKAMRAEGFAQYSVRPPGERALYSSIIYLEPFSGRNLAAFGFDMYSEPIRAWAMRSAGTSGVTAISGKVKLVQETHGKAQAGFLMYVPVYRKNQPLNTVQERWNALQGFVYSPYRVDDLMRGLRLGNSRPLNFRIFDGQDESEETLMYDAAGEDETEQAAASRSQITAAHTLEIYGRSWTIRFNSLPDIEYSWLGRQNLLVLSSGGGFSLLLFFFVSFLSSRREQAEAIALEMTEGIRRNEAELIASENRIRALFDTIADGIIVIDAKGVIQSMNPAAITLFGYSMEEARGRNIRMMMPEPYAGEHDGYMNSYLSTGKKKVIGIGREVTGQRKDGSTFPMDLAVSEMEVNGERMFTGIVRDITERRRIEKMKTEFVSTVSHELRTPLTSIRGALGLITGGAVGAVPEQAGAMLRIASNNTERLLLLINDILDMQKIESGQMAFRFKSLELMPFLRQSLQDMASYGQQHGGVQFVITKEIEGIHVYADPDRLGQVMSNLLSNAAKFSPAGASVEVTVAQHEDRLRVAVTDHGPGIPEAFQPKLFERFTQADSSDTRSKGGTGLGLAITKAIVEKHGGHISFVTREGVGTTFLVDLPLLTGGQVGATARDLPQHHQACVLIVEDDPDVAALIQRMLAEAGFDADIAHDAAQARALLACNGDAYKLMTLDLALPGEDGASLLASLRSEAATRALPVVVLSASADETKQRLNGGAIGVLDWLRKPIDEQRLVNVVRQVTRPGHLPRVLHVEDDADICRVVHAMLHEHCDLLFTDTLAAARDALARQEFDLVLLDIGLPDGSGLALLDIIEQRARPPQVVIFSAQDVSQADANRVSAVLVKSRTSNDKLLEVLENAIDRGAARASPPGCTFMPREVS